MFEEYWSNPSAGIAGVPGTFFVHSVGDVDFFALNSSFDYSPGSAQYTWFEEALAVGVFQRFWKTA